MFDIWSNSLLDWILSAFLVFGIILLPFGGRLGKRKNPKSNLLDFSSDGIPQVELVEEILKD